MESSGHVIDYIAEQPIRDSRRMHQLLRSAPGDTVENPARQLMLPWGVTCGEFCIGQVIIQTVRRKARTK